MSHNTHRDYIKASGDLFTSYIAYLRRQLVWHRLHRTAPCYTIAPRLLSKSFVQHGVVFRTTARYFTEYFGKQRLEMCPARRQPKHNRFSRTCAALSAAFLSLNFLQSARRCDSAQRLHLSLICIWSALVICEETREMLDCPFSTFWYPVRRLNNSHFSLDKVHKVLKWRFASIAFYGRSKSQPGFL